MTLKPNHRILVVEDSEDDYMATVRAFKKAGLANPIDRCVNGDDALDYIFHRGKYTSVNYDAPLGIILLDLNMHGTDGREVLKTIKRDDSVKSIPVIVLTTSNDERDIQACYAEGANSYMHKPVEIKGFIEAIVRLKEYWFEVVVLPKDS